MSSEDIPVSTTPQTNTSEVRQKRTYHMVFVGDFGSESLTTRTDVDADSFADVLAGARCGVAIAMPDPLSGSGEWEFRLDFDSLQDFDPEGLLQLCDPGRWRLGLRDKLLERQTGKISQEDLDKAIAAAVQTDPTLGWLTGQSEPAAPAAPEGGSILDMVDPPSASSVGRDVEDLAAGAGDASKRMSGDQSKNISAQLASLEREASAIADALLKHPDVRRLETVWRSVKFIIDRVDFREGVRLALVNAKRDEAVDKLIEQVIEPAFEGEIPTPGLLIFDYPCAKSAEDLALMDYLAQHAQSLPAPVAVPVDSQFFELKALRLLKNLPHLGGLTDSWEYAKWRTLREQPYAKSLAPVLGRFILRAPHAPRPKKAALTESVNKISDLVWCHGHVAMAVLAAQAFVAHGWPTRMYGATAGKIEDLAMADNPNDPQNPWGPGDLFLPDRRLDELPTIGMNQLLSVKGRDYCMLMGGVSAAKPVVTKEIGTHQAALEISLPYQQVSSAISATICELMPTLRGESGEQIQQKLLAELTFLLGITGEEDADAVQVGVGSDPNMPGQTIVQVRVIPPPRVAPGELPIDFGFAV